MIISTKSYRDKKDVKKLTQTGDDTTTKLVGSYSGTYRLKGSDSLVRITDGLKLVIGTRSGSIPSRSSERYLVDKRPNKGYLSNLYDNEFDDRIHRYRIVQIEADDHSELFLIEAIRLLKGNRKSRRNGSNV